MNNQKYAPVIIPTLNRYEHLKQLVDSLKQCEEAKYTELVLGLDYPPAERYKGGYNKVKEYLPTISGFGKVTILDTDINLGFDKNYERLRNYVWEHGYDSYIFSEDDNIFAPSFLSYLNWGLKTFKDDSSVLAICSYREIDEPIPDYPNNFYKAGGVRPYGFGIWKDRWERFEKRTEFETMKSFVDKMPLYSVFNLEKVRVACKYLYLYTNRIVHGDFCMGQMCTDENMFCITPLKSLSKNIGSDGSGLHGANQKIFQKELERVLDNSTTFTPVWIEKKLFTPAVVKAENQIAKELKTHSFKQFSRYCFYILKFLVYKTTGRIISYKQN